VEKRNKIPEKKGEIPVYKKTRNAGEWTWMSVCACIRYDSVHAMHRKIDVRKSLYSPNNELKKITQNLYFAVLGIMYFLLLPLL